MLVAHHQKTINEAGEANKEPIQISAIVNAERLPLPARFPSPIVQEIINPPTSIMHELVVFLPPIAAIGYSMIYLLFGGSFGGAVVIFIIAKLLGR